MPIIQPKSIPSTIPEFQALVATQIRNSSTTLFSQMAGSYKTLFALIWSNPRLTPQQVFDGLGTDAGTLLQLGVLLKATILEAYPATVLPDAPNVIVFNSDGTVTVGAAIQTIDPATGEDTNISDQSPSLLSSLKSAISSVLSKIGIGG